jgi:hypothetical protein
VRILSIDRPDFVIGVDRIVKEDEVEQAGVPGGADSITAQEASQETPPETPDETMQETPDEAAPEMPDEDQGD